MFGHNLGLYSYEYFWYCTFFRSTNSSEIKGDYSVMDSFVKSVMSFLCVLSHISVSSGLIVNSLWTTGRKFYNIFAIMDRGRKAMPVQNKLCNQRNIKRCQEMHRQKVRRLLLLLFRHFCLTYSHAIYWCPLLKLRDMKCFVDNKPPRQATHLCTKAKKNALMEDRIAQIETENRLLLQKMSHIMVRLNSSQGQFDTQRNKLNQ